MTDAPRTCPACHEPIPCDCDQRDLAEFLKLPGGGGIIRMSWDHEHNIADISLATRAEYEEYGPVRSREVRLRKGEEDGHDTDLVLDISTDGRLFGIEVLDPASHLPRSLREPVRFVREAKGEELSRDELLRLSRPEIVEKFDRLTEEWAARTDRPDRVHRVVPVLTFYYHLERPELSAGGDATASPGS